MTSSRTSTKRKTFIKPPILMGCSKDHHSIQWTWKSSPEYCYALVDEQDQIIVRLAFGKNKYTEMGLEPGQTYYRKLAAYTNESSSAYSSLIGVTTQTTYEALAPTPYQPFIQAIEGNQPDQPITELLPAFQSGVGYGSDLKIEKQDLTHYQESFSLGAKVEGVYRQKIKSYTTIPFQYRVKAMAQETVESHNGFVKFQTTAYDKALVSFDVIRYATATFNVRARLRFEVEYYVKEFGTIKAERLTMYTRALSHDLDQKEKVKYDEVNGALYLEPSVIKLSDLTVQELIEETIRGNALVSAYHEIIPCKVYGLLLEDDYPYTSEGDDVYRFGKERVFAPSGSGTINAVLKGSENEMDCCLYLEGYARAGLYSGYQHYEKEIDSSEKYTNVALSNAELKNIPIKNVDDPSYSFQFSLKEITSTIERLKVKADRPERIKTTVQIPDTVSNDPVVIIQFSEATVSEVVRYQYDSMTFHTLLSYYKHIPSITSSPENEYLFSTEILDCSSNILINQKPVKKGDILKQKGTPLAQLEIMTRATQEVKEWSMILPALEEPPLSGVVNDGDREVNGGKKDYLTYTPKFPFPTEMVPGTLLLQCHFESLNEEESLIQVTFDDEIYQHNRSGGMMCFSSEAFTYQEVPLKSLITEKTFYPLEIEGLKEVPFILSLTAPKENRLDGDMEYEYYELSITSSHKDVHPVHYPTRIEFDDEGNTTFTVGCRIQQNATSKWSPRLHSGFYYLNQQEYFIPSEFIATAEYSENNVFEEESFDVNLHALIKQSMPITRVIEKWKLPNEYCGDQQKYEAFQYSLTKEEMDLHHWVEVKPTIDTTYYKKYQNVSYISPIKSLAHVIDVYGEFKWKEVKDDQTTITPFIRVFDLERNKWTDWVSIKKGYALEGLPSSNLAQVRFDFTFSQEENTKTFEDIYNCSYDFRRIYSDESTNVNFDFDVIQGDNPTKEAVFLTNVLDRGTNVFSTFSGKSSNQSLVTYYVATSNDPETLMTAPKWRNCGGDSFVDEERYVRYKIVIPPREEVYYFKLTTKTKVLSEVMAKIGDFSLAGRKEGSFRYEEVYRRYTYTRPLDGKVTLLEASMKPLLTEVAESEGYTFEDVFEFYLTSGNPHFELQYDLKDTETSLYARSLELQVHEAILPSIQLENQKAVIKGLPQQFSPVLVEHPLYGPFVEDDNLSANQTFKCRYDWLRQTTEIEVRTEEPISEIYVSFETSQTSNYRPINHLSLNPIYNLANEGFIYISYERPVPFELTVQANPTVFLPYREDSTAVYVRLTDKYGNAVPGYLLQAGSSIGRLTCENYTTDQNGVVMFRYNSPKGTGTERLTFQVKDDSSIRAEIQMIVKE